MVMPKIVNDCSKNSVNSGIFGFTNHLDLISALFSTTFQTPFAIGHQILPPFLELRDLKLSFNAYTGCIHVSLHG